MHRSPLELSRKRVELNVCESFKYFTKDLYIQTPPQTELFTHTMVNGKKLATSKFQSRRGGGQGANARSCFFNPSHSYLDHLKVIKLNKRRAGGEEDPPPQGRILTTFLLQGANNEGGFGLISALFLLQRAGD